MTVPDILTGDELIEVLEEGMPESPDFIQEVREFVADTPSLLGYGVAETTCDPCGQVSFAVYAVPSQFPSQCPYCGQWKCYVTAVPGDKDK